MDPVVSKYLDRYAEDEVSTIPALEATYPEVLVIPAYRESWESLQRVWSGLPASTLIIVVINSPTPDDPATVELLEAVHQAGTRIGEQAHLTLTDIAERHVMTVDRVRRTRTLPARQGVGLARKIGADIALKLIATGTVTSQRIALTDADVRLPSGYFSPALSPEDAAMVYPFRHHAVASLILPNLLYEISMLYYVAGLKWSCSPYAFPTIGSLITVSARHYAMVRGFPRRNAAEDFYLLNKLAKTGPVRLLSSPEVDIEARLSDRVPVGTGPGLRRILTLAHPVDEYDYYNPTIFTELRDFLYQTAQNPESVRDRVSTAVQAWGDSTGAWELFDKQQQRTTSQAVFQKFLHDWFDGFRTLKFVHALREAYPSVPLSGIANAPFIRTSLAAPVDSVDLRRLRDQLADYCYGDPARKF